MVFLYAILFVILLIQSKQKYGKYFNFVSIFTFGFFFFASISTFGFYNLIVPNVYVHLMIITYVVIVDFIVLRSTNTKQRVSLVYNEKTNCDKMVCLVQIFAIILTFFNLFNALKILVSTGNLFEARAFYYSSDFADRYIFNLLTKEAPVGIIYALIIYYVFCFFSRKKTKYIFYAVVNTVILTIITGGRYALMQLLLSLILVYTEFGAENVNEKKQKKKLRIFGSIAIVFIVFITIAKSGNLIKQIVVYYSGSFSFFEYILENPDVFEANEKLFGYLTFGAILEPIVLFLKFIGVTSTKTPAWYFNIHCQNFYDISRGPNSIYFNNNTSVLYYFYRDFGYIGICIGAVLIGVLISKFYKQWRQTGIQRFGLFYLYFAIIAINSIMTYQFFGCSPFFSVLTLLCISRGKKYNE